MFRIDAPISALNVAEELLHPVVGIHASFVPIPGTGHYQRLSIL